MLKIGFCGLGNIGKLHFLDALNITDIKIVAAADKSRRNLRIAKEHNVNVYCDYKQLIDSEELDAVIISLPNFLKKESILYSSEKNLDIFVDKPLARNVREALSIAQKVRKQGIKLMVGVNYRYFDSVQKLKRIYDEGRMGEIVIATSELITDGPFSQPILVPKAIPEWWFRKEMVGGGAVLDLGYHLIDIFNWIFGELNVLHSTLGYRLNLPMEDSAIVTLMSKATSTKIVLSLGWFSKTDFPNPSDFRIDLHGTRGHVSSDEFSSKGNAYLSAIKEAPLNFLKKAIRRKTGALFYRSYSSSLVKTLETFFESLQEDKEIPVSLMEQVEIMNTIEKIYKQHVVVPNA